MRVTRAAPKLNAAAARPPLSTSCRPPSAAFCLLLTACCLLPAAFFGALAQKRDAEESPAQAAMFHRWGAVTLFHGLPSDRVRAIAQDAEGLLWFGTDAGLARYDGRRTQTVTEAGLAAARVLALRADGEGALWVGTDDGAYLRTPAGEFKAVAETKGLRVTAVITPARGRAVVATSDGLVFDCRRRDDGTYSAAPLAEQILPGPPPPGAPASASSASARPPLELTSLAASGETILVGTRGRGLLAVERGSVREVASRPRAFFFEALERDGGGRVHAGAQAPASDSGLFRVEAGEAASADSPPARAAKVAGEATGTVNALRFDARGDLYVGTDGRGVFRLREGRRVERFTFAGTAGALRSDRVYSVFIDREGVAWFGTDRGVCRYDPRGLRVENVSEELDGNFVRTLYRTSAGRLLAGTNRGLYVRERDAASWRAVEEIGRRAVYSIAEDRRGRVLVASAGGLHASLAPEKSAAPGTIRFTPEEKKEEEAGDEAEGGVKTKAAEAGATAPDGPTAPAAAPTPTPAPQAGEGRPEQKEAASAERAEPERPASVSRPTLAPAVAGTIRAVAVFGGATHIATWGRGVERLDEELRRTTLWPRSEADDARGREAVSLYADEQGGRLWVGTTGGVFYLDAEGVKTEPAHATLDGATVYGVSRGPGGWLWLATNRGLYAHPPGGSLVEAAPGRDARAVLAVTPPATAAAGGEAAAEASRPAPPQAWCATAGGGVIKVLLDEQFGPVTAALDAEQGLPSQNAFALLGPAPAGEGGDEQTLAVATSRGVALYGPGAAPPVIRPVQVVAARPLALEDLEAAGRDGERRGLYLAYPQNGLVLDVAANSSRTFPEQFQYAFLLTDDSGKTITRKLAHNPQFRVEGLRPGRYRITARAFTIDLVPSAPFGFEFVVARAPFPWTITALSVLLSLSLVALVWGYVQHRKIVRAGSDLLEANRQLAAARLQLANEAESERRRIARDLHDQTLADLRRLMLLADEMRPAAAAEAPAPAAAPAAGATAGVSGAAGLVGADDAAAGARAPAPALDPAVLRAEIESVSQEIRRICEDLSPSVLENVGFAAALEWALAERVAHMPPDCKFTYEFSCDEHLEERLHFAPGVQMQVYRIVQEAVSNVCRHADATHVRLLVSADEEGRFHLTLEDDGRGFDTDRRKARGGRGLASIRARASMIDAEVRWQHRPDAEGGGTRFTLRKGSAPT